MTAQRSEAGELVLDSQKVLEGAERGEDQPEPFLREIEALHRSVHEAQVFRRTLAAKFFEHRFGGIQARARDPVPGDREQDPPGGAAKHHHPAAR
jgi:hypothetical protein